MSDLIWKATAFFLFLSPITAVVSWDFMERPSAVVLAPAPEPVGLLTAGYYHTIYRNYLFRNSMWDQFHIEGYGHQSLFDLAPFRLGVFYSSILLSGPLNEGETPGAAAAPWQMNAIQFEYGVVATVDLPASRPARLAVIAEYSRRSYHPLRPRLFDDPAADILRGGFAVMDMRPKRITGIALDAMVRAGWVELYDFWGAPSIVDPRALYVLNLAVEVRQDIGLEGASLFANAATDVIALRAGGVAADVSLQAGLSAGTGPARLELYLEAYHSDDTEQLPDAPSRATLFGWGARFIVATS